MPHLNLTGNHGPGPSTPQHPPNGKALENLISSLERKWKLGIEIRGKDWSPNKSGDSLTVKVNGLIKRLYWTNGPALKRSITTFETLAPSISNPDAQLDLLYRKLKGGADSPLPMAGTPLSARNAPPRALKQPPSKQTHQPSRTLDYEDEDPESCYMTAPEPGSPTDNDDDDDDELTTPQSPTLSSMSAQRRVQQASPRFSLGSVGKRQPSDTPNEHDESSLKFRKTSKGNQASDRRYLQDPPRLPSPLFKKPTLDMARSFHRTSFQESSMTTSVNTSFDTISSSQQTQPDTVNTSSTSDAGDEAGIYYPSLKGISSMTLGSLDEQALMANLTRQEREGIDCVTSQGSQALTRESSSTFGSIDEDGLLEASFKAEASIPVINLPMSPRSSPARATTPATSKTHTPRAGLEASSHVLSSKKSPAKVTYYIRDLPHDGLFVKPPPDELLHFPFFILWICCRISLEKGISMGEIMNGMDSRSVCSDPELFWSVIEKHPEITHVAQDPRGVWERQCDGYTFKGRVVFNNNDNKRTSVFKFEPHLLEPDKTCRFQRKYGTDRFLFLNFPSFDQNLKQNATFTSDDKLQIKEQWNAWFLRVHEFLGRKWKAFHIEGISKKAKRKKAKDDISDKRVILFAIQGPGLIDISVGHLINWFIPLDLNRNQNFCKAFARLDLGLSRTIPTLIFKQSQVRYVKDTLADGSPEDARFNDHRLSWSEECSEPRVMNDGCSIISVGAALQIWRLYEKATNSRGPLPSAFQGRIGGAKGMWMVSAESFTRDPKHTLTWINITQSQRKFRLPPEYEDDDQYDPVRLTFEYSDHSSSPSPSELHIAFIPILVDRGVPRDVIATVAKNVLDIDRDKLLDALSDPAKTNHWVHGQTASNSNESHWQAALPHALPQKIKLLLRSGFIPGEAPFLSMLLLIFIQYRHIQMEEKLRIPLGKSTFLFGVADPLGVLAPGEVHIVFSSSFVDEASGETFTALDGLDILVARQPACRRSDVQRVRATKRSELSHLVDVVVFPSRGKYPLADKLQGGDYDGDLFWLCWEVGLATPFRNAPAPLQSLDPAYYGIEKDTRTLSDVMNLSDPPSVGNLLREVLKFRTTPSLLGRVTTLLEKQAYKENRVYSKTLNALCDIHDLLVDAPKQAYIFTRKDFESCIDKLIGKRPENPAYKQEIEDCENANGMRKIDELRKKTPKFKMENINDFLYFAVVRQHNIDTLAIVEKDLPRNDENDSALQYPYANLRSSGSPAVQQELDALVNSLKDLYQKWNSRLANDSNPNSEPFNHVVDSCYEEFIDLVPQQDHDPEIRALINPYLGPEFALWNDIRASALYNIYPHKHYFVWHMAGERLARMKSPGRSAQSVTNNILSNLKPKPIKTTKPLGTEDGDNDSESILEQQP